MARVTKVQLEQRVAELEQEVDELLARLKEATAPQRRAVEGKLHRIPHLERRG